MPQAGHAYCPRASPGGGRSMITRLVWAGVAAASVASVCTGLGYHARRCPGNPPRGRNGTALGAAAP